MLREDVCDGIAGDSEGEGEALHDLGEDVRVDFDVFLARGVQLVEEAFDFGLEVQLALALLLGACVSDGYAGGRTLACWAA